MWNSATVEDLAAGNRRAPEDGDVNNAVGERKEPNFTAPCISSIGLRV
jgi:hypothetical protein